MKNTLTDLNNYLFESLERINDDELDDAQLDKEIKRSRAVSKVASTIISNADVQLKALELSAEYGYTDNGQNVISALLKAKDNG